MYQKLGFQTCSLETASKHGVQAGKPFSKFPKMAAVGESHAFMRVYKKLQGVLDDNSERCEASLCAGENHLSCFLSCSISKATQEDYLHPPISCTELRGAGKLGLRYVFDHFELLIGKVCS